MTLCIFCLGNFICVVVAPQDIFTAVVGVTAGGKLQNNAYPHIGEYCVKLNRMYWQFVILWNLADQTGTNGG